MSAFSHSAFALATCSRADTEKPDGGAQVRACLPLR